MRIWMGRCCCCCCWLVAAGARGVGAGGAAVRWQRWTALAGVRGCCLSRLAACTLDAICASSSLSLSSLWPAGRLRRPPHGPHRPARPALADATDATDLPDAAGEGNGSHGGGSAMRFMTCSTATYSAGTARMAAATRPSTASLGGG
ncbi:hypothetical protein BC831DRAFT_459812 [Entophlyctis helioformis]|nr:hypothetical protein BC831DRAFT_459812 [Entophlyctis helioformis]